MTRPDAGGAGLALTVRPARRGRGDGWGGGYNDRAGVVRERGRRWAVAEARGVRDSGRRGIMPSPITPAFGEPPGERPAEPLGELLGEPPHATGPGQLPELEFVPVPA